MKHYFLLISLIFGLTQKSLGGQAQCIDKGNNMNGRIAATSLYKSLKKQPIDLAALNLKNLTQKENSLASVNSAISITLTDFGNFTAAGKTWLLYENDNASFTMNIGNANNTTPQSWVLPANFLTYFEGTGRDDFVNMSQVPSALRITGANKYMRTAYFDENDRPMDVYDQYDLANDGVYHIGSSYRGWQ
jgi:hypothetical protein